MKAKRWCSIVVQGLQILYSQTIPWLMSSWNHCWISRLQALSRRNLTLNSLTITTGKIFLILDIYWYPHYFVCSHYFICTFFIILSRSSPQVFLTFLSETDIHLDARSDHQFFKEKYSKRTVYNTRYSFSFNSRWKLNLFKDEHIVTLPLLNDSKLPFPRKTPKINPKKNPQEHEPNPSKV